MSAWIALGAVPAAAQASTQYQLTPETRLAAQFASYARTCTVEKDVRDRFDWRAVASPPPDCPSFVPRFLGMRINTPGWRPQDGLQ